MHIKRVPVMWTRGEGAPENVLCDEVVLLSDHQQALHEAERRGIGEAMYAAMAVNQYSDSSDGRFIACQNKIIHAIKALLERQAQPPAQDAVNTNKEEA